jgi:hypothetical protein
MYFLVHMYTTMTEPIVSRYVNLKMKEVCILYIMTSKANVWV